MKAPPNHLVGNESLPNRRGPQWDLRERRDLQWDLPNRRVRNWVSRPAPPDPLAQKKRTPPCGGGVRGGEPVPSRGPPGNETGG